MISKNFFKISKYKNRTGFTLIELLVVISIIGMLSSIVLASLNTARMKARDAKRKSDVNAIIKAIQLYYDQFSSYSITTPTGNLTGYYFTAPGSAIGCADLSYGVSAGSYRYRIIEALANRGFLSGNVVDPKYGIDSCSFMKYDITPGTCIYSRLENTSDSAYNPAIDPGVCGGDCGMRYRVCIN